MKDDKRTPRFIYTIRYFDTRHGRGGVWVTQWGNESRGAANWAAGDLLRDRRYTDITVRQYRFAAGRRAGRGAEQVRLSEAQFDSLQRVQRGAWCLKNQVAAALQRRRLVKKTGTKCEEHGDPYWTITDAGRAALEAAKRVYILAPLKPKKRKAKR